MPVYAALIGMALACWIGYHRGDIVFGWVATYTALLGWRTDRALNVISPRPISEQLTYLFRPEDIAFFAVEAVVLGTIAFTIGKLIQWGRDSLHKPTAT